jgi:hypothetical protein
MLKSATLASACVVLLALLGSAASLKNTSIAVAAAAEPKVPTYKAVPDWAMKDSPEGIGNTNGGIAVSSKGEVYIGVQPPVVDGKATQDPRSGIRVFAPDGRFLRNMPNAPADLHQFIIRKEKDGEFLYGVRFVSASRTPAGLDPDGMFVKMTLEGKTVLNLRPSAIPDKYKDTERNTENGKLVLRMAAVVVAPNDDIYVSDGYASDYVHRFDRTGKYLDSFGGKKEPYSFNSIQGLTVDTRFTPVRLLGSDRENNRLVHLALDGKFLGVVAKDMWRPSATAIWGDYAIVAELKGRVSVVDKAGAVVSTFAVNTADDETASANTAPAKWRQGIVTAPHGIALNDHGDVFIGEFNRFGRLHRFNRQ